MKLTKKQFSILVIILMTIALMACKKNTPSIESVAYEVNNNLLKTLNKIRNAGCKCGADTILPISALQSNAILQKTAELFALDMFKRNYFSHINPEGLSAINRARTQGYQGNAVGEIIAKDYTSIEDVIQGWLKSETHCRAIMDKSYNEMGGGRVSNYWVVNFGSK